MAIRKEKKSGAPSFYFSHVFMSVEYLKETHKQGPQVYQLRNTAASKNFFLKIRSYYVDLIILELIL